MDFRDVFGAALPDPPPAEWAAIAAHHDRIGRQVTDLLRGLQGGDEATGAMSALATVMARIARWIQGLPDDPQAVAAVMARVLYDLMAAVDDECAAAAARN